MGEAGRERGRDTYTHRHAHSSPQHTDAHIQTYTQAPQCIPHGHTHHHTQTHRHIHTHTHKHQGESLRGIRERKDRRYQRPSERRGEAGRVNTAQASQTEREPRQRQKDWRAERQHRLAARALRTENVLELQRPGWEGSGQAQVSGPLHTHLRPPHSCTRGGLQQVTHPQSLGERAEGAV